MTLPQWMTLVIVIGAVALFASEKCASIWLP